MIPIARVYLLGFGTGALIWLASLLAPSPQRFWLWGLGLAVDFATPWVARSVLRSIPLDWSHLVERLGTFSSIVLSVAIAGVVIGTPGNAPNLQASIAASLAFSLAVCAWWVYSAFLEKFDLSSTLGSGQPFIYGHLLVVIGLSVLSAGVRRAVAGAGEGIASPAAYWLIGGGCALWVLAMVQLRWLVVGRQEARMYGLYGVPLVASASVALAGPRVPINIALGILVLAFVVVLVVARRWRIPGSRPTPLAPADR
jgi:low temperature requirement protein LtrA